MNKVKKRIKDNDLVSAEVALRRAARRARTIAEKTHTPLVIYENGKVVKEIMGKKRKNRKVENSCLKGQKKNSNNYNFL